MQFIVQDNNLYIAVNIPLFVYIFVFFQKWEIIVTCSE